MIIGIDASRANQLEKTGTEWYSWHLIRALAPRLKGHHIRLYTRETPELGLSNLGPHVETRVLSWPLGLLWSHLRLAWELLWHPPDVLFVPADTVPLIRRCPTVTTIHDIAFERFPELYAQRSVQRRLGWLRPAIHLLVRLVTFGEYSASERDYHRWSVRHALRVSRQILTVSEFTKGEMVDLLDADPNRILVTYQGVKQPSDFSAITDSDRNQAANRLGLSKPFFLYVGRLESKKNIAQIIRGYQAYRTTVTDPADLVLVGNPGFGWEPVAEEIKTDKLSASIHQLGWQNDATLDILYTMALGFIFLSAYEGFGRPPLESMSAGVPVLASSYGSLSEVLGSAAYYVNPQDISAIATGLRELQQVTPLREALISAGRHQVRRFTWAATADLTAQVLIRD